MVTIHLCLHKIPVRISLQLPKGGPGDHPENGRRPDPGQQRGNRANPKRGIPFRVTPAEDVMGEIVVNPADCQSKADNTTIL